MKPNSIASLILSGDWFCFRLLQKEILEVFRAGRAWMGDVVDEGREFLLLPPSPSKVCAGTLRGFKKFCLLRTELTSFQLMLGKKIEEVEKVLNSQLKWEFPPCAVSPCSSQFVLDPTWFPLAFLVPRAP